ncbi:hypothetical protein [Actinomadura rugatobispora]|uniref:Uncharacterized protein n=1 Tax=Actinomadura rugatobispora TaxID=1994 RepID=A0ABW0ZSD3_9ACTN|nr:hypothetical protein GCM10010200_077490 [Actinomadura rugatobispora]
MRSARVFDRPAANGERPSVNRPPVPDDEVPRVVEYLRNAKTVIAARSYAPDDVEPSRGDRVPLVFKTDGAWVWAGAVYYYLDEHGIAPEPDLVAHIRAQGHRLAEVDDATLEIAIQIATGQREPDPAPPPGAHAPQQQGAPYGQPGAFPGGPPPPGGAPYPPPPGYGPGLAGPGGPPPVPGPFPGAPMPAPGGYPPPPMPPGPPGAYPGPPAPPVPFGAGGPPPLPNAFPGGPFPGPGYAPYPGPGQQAPMADDPLADLERRLKDLGVDPAAYRINQVAEGAWCLVPEAGRWSVFLVQNGRRRKQMLCDTADRAAAYLLGAALFYRRPLP